MTFSVKKIGWSHTRRNFEDNDLILFLNSQNSMCLPVKLKKTAVQQPQPTKTAIFRRKLTFSGHTRRIFNDNDTIFWSSMAWKCQFSAKNSGFRRERRLNLQNQKIRLCKHKNQLLTRITFTVSLKIKPENQMCQIPPPLFPIQLVTV